MGTFYHPNLLQIIEELTLADLADLQGLNGIPPWAKSSKPSQSTRGRKVREVQRPKQVISGTDFRTFCFTREMGFYPLSTCMSLLMALFQWPTRAFLLGGSGVSWGVNYTIKCITV